MENWHFWLRSLYPFALGYLSEGIHDVGNIDAVGTAGSTGLTRSTNPDSIAIQDLILQTQMNGANDFMWRDIHGKGYRTTVGALFTLETGGDFLSAFSLYCFAEGRVGDYCFG